MPTVDRVDLLRRCLRGLAAQEPPVDVLVVHTGDERVRALLAEAGVRGLVSPVRGASAQRNAGWRAATGDRVAFTDDDCEPAPGWAAALLADGGDLVAGPVRPHPQDTATGPWARTVTAEEPGTYPGCNLLVRRDLLARVGGFDEALSGGEDTDLAWRVVEGGGRAGWAPGALVWHAVREVGFAEHLRSLPRWAGLPLVVRRHPGLRAHAHRRVFWKRSHPLALLALVSLGAALADRRALLGALPLAARHAAAGPRTGAQRVVNDLAEVAVLAAGSVRHRGLLL